MHPAGSIVPLDGLAEASGLASAGACPAGCGRTTIPASRCSSRSTARGAVTGQLRVTGAAVEDWEAIAVGPCGSGSCLYIGDIGDNDARRKRITIYRVPEPDGAERHGGRVRRLSRDLPDGAARRRDAAGLADGRLYIVTKGETGPVAIYGSRRSCRPAPTMKLERVGRDARRSRERTLESPTARSSPDGQWVVLRTKSRADVLSRVGAARRQVARGDTRRSHARWASRRARASRSAPATPSFSPAKAAEEGGRHVRALHLRAGDVDLRAGGYTSALLAIKADRAVLHAA